MAQFITYSPSKSNVIKAPEISVLVPVMNEAGNIRALIDEICDTFSPFTVEKSLRLVGKKRGTVTGFRF